MKKPPERAAGKEMSNLGENRSSHGMGQSNGNITCNGVIKMGKGIFDPYYVAEVLSDLLSRQRGREVKIILTPKEPNEKIEEDPVSG